MIIVTENRKLKVCSSYTKKEKDGRIIFRNKYGVIRLIVRKDNVVAFGNGIDNEHDNVSVIE